MSVMSPNETTKVWRTQSREPAVHLYLSGADNCAADLLGARIAGLSVDLRLLPSHEQIDAEELNGAAAAVVQVDADSPLSIKRFEVLAASTKTPMVVAAYEPPLAFVRALLRSGATDVLPLPLNKQDLELALAPVQKEIETAGQGASVKQSRLVSVIKAGGGIGATSLLGQLAIRFAENEAIASREACLLDLDVQFGDVAFQLGLRPKLSLGDLLDARSRLDGALVRSSATSHTSGLKVIASPPEMMPLEAVAGDQIIEIVDQAEREFGTVFVDLPANWTNWSLSLIARSDMVLLITSLELASLARARRQIDLIQAQDLGDIDVRVVVNRYEKGIFKTIRPADVRQALGRDVAHTVADDPMVMRTAVDRGIPISQVKRKSAVGKDIDSLEAALALTLKLER